MNGFVGKVTLGMLLARFPGFKHLHMLMRAKRGVSPRERFEKDVLPSPCLQPIVAQTDPAVLRDKIAMHAGDVGEPLCGLSPQSIEELKGRVSLVINIAGLVEFTPPVDESFKSNVDGVENVLELATLLNARLVHVSTCFVCGESDGLVEEDEPISGFYPRRKSHADNSFRPRDEIRFIRERVSAVYEEAKVLAAKGRENPRETRQKLADLGLQRAQQWGWVNTYTYSKSLGEQLIATEPGLEYSIVRPAIVEAALDFPFPGWVEGGRTAAPLVMMAMSGLRHWALQAKAPMEVVPVDQVAAAILTAAVLLLHGKAHPVYQLGTADRNPVAWENLVDWMWRDYCKNTGRPRRLTPGPKILRLDVHRKHARKLASRIELLYAVTSGLKSILQRAKFPGSKPVGKFSSRMRNLGRQLAIRESALAIYRPFMYDNRFVFESENIRAANAMLSEEDRRRLPWAPEHIDWRRYWCDNEVKGIQKWVEGDAAKGRSFRI